MKKIILLTFIVLLVSNVYGLGIAPARTDLEFITTQQEGKLRIIVDHTPVKVTLKTEEELGKYIELENDVLLLEEKETWVNFKVSLPKNLPPGDRKGSILISELPVTTDGAVIYAVPAIKHNVFVKVPYPGKYLSAKSFITNTKVNEQILFTIALANWGQEIIDNAKAVIVIKGPTNEEIAVLETDTTSVNPKKESKLTATWLTENSGSYFAEITVQYNNKILSLSQTFNVGNLEVEIERIQVNNFKIGQIAKLDIYLRNKWNKPLQVDGRVEIFQNNNMISSFNTVPVEIQPKSISYMEAYWNTEGIQTGEYDMLVKANYNGQSAERLFNSIVSIDKIQFTDISTGQVVAEEGRNTTLLVIVVLILIILNIFLFIYINKRLKKREYS